VCGWALRQDQKALEALLDWSYRSKFQEGSPTARIPGSTSAPDKLLSYQSGTWSLCSSYVVNLDHSVQFSCPFTSRINLLVHYLFFQFAAVMWPYQSEEPGQMIQTTSSSVQQWSDPISHSQLSGLYWSIRFNSTYILRSNTIVIWCTLRSSTEYLGQCRRFSALILTSGHAILHHWSLKFIFDENAIPRSCYCFPHPVWEWWKIFYTPEAG